MTGMKPLSFKCLSGSLIIAFSSFLVDCNDSSPSEARAVTPGSYIYRNRTQTTSLEINLDGTFKETITYSKDSKVFTCEGKWKQEDLSISFEPFLTSVNWESGAEISPPRQSDELVAKLNGDIIIINEHIDYWFNLVRRK